MLRRIVTSAWRKSRWGPGQEDPTNFFPCLGPHIGIDPGSLFTIIEILLQEPKAPRSQKA